MLDGQPFEVVAAGCDRKAIARQESHSQSEIWEVEEIKENGTRCCIAYLQLIRHGN